MPSASDPDLTKGITGSIILAAVHAAAYGSVAQLGERTVRIREVRGFDPLQIHQKNRLVSTSRFFN